MAASDFDQLLAEIRACRVCAPFMPHAPRPVVQASPGAKILIVGQAPGTRVHASGRPFTDPSGDRLRGWMGVDEAVFYDASKIAIAPMGFCFPGLDAAGSDLPPRKECAPLWQRKLTDQLVNLRLTLLVGLHAQRFYLGSHLRKTMTDTVRDFQAFGPDYIPLPHPSWRNSAWLRKNPWFEAKNIPMLQCRIKELLQ